MKREGGFRLRAVHAFALTLALCGVMGGYLVIETASASPEDSALTILARGLDWPILSHLLVTLPALAAFVWLLLRRRTIALPGPRIGVPLATLGGLAWASALASQYRGLALPGAVEWSAYGLVFFGIVAGGGRNGGRLLLGAIVAGGTVTALLAVRQYGDMKATDPGFRVFGPWNNPNATGAYLAIALVLALALLQGAERLAKLGFGLAATLIGLGLALTQSKGAWLAAAVGLSVWLLSLALMRSGRAVAAVGGSVLVLGLVAVFSFVATRPPASGGASTGGGFTRITGAEASSSQSVGFRKLLWRSALDLARDEPLNGGLGSFGPRSAKPGLVTQTQLAHSTPLQLSAELTPLGGVLFLLFFALVAWTSLRGARALGEERKAVLAGAGGALACALLHNFTDSDAYTFGLGITLFALAAVLLLAASDTTAPELVPLPWRVAGAGTIAGVLLLWAYVGWIDATIASARGLAYGGRLDEGRESAESAVSLAPFDARAWGLVALLAGSPDRRLAASERAVETGPTARYWRALGRARATEGNSVGAERAFRAALKLDPNNFPALSALRDLLEASGNNDEAKAVARQTVRVEGTTYYTTRSQPELVPTDTADARLYLARSETGKVKAELLAQALAIYRSYARSTIPLIVRYSVPGGGDYAGETREHGESVLSAGQRIIAELRSSGYDRAALDDAAADFDRAAVLLRRESSAK